MASVSALVEGESVIPRDVAPVVVIGTDVAVSVAAAAVEDNKLILLMPEVSCVVIVVAVVVCAAAAAIIVAVLEKAVTVLF